MFDKYFTLQEAEALIPTVERITDSIRNTKKTLDACDEEFAALDKRITASGGLWVSLNDWTSKRLLRETAASKIAEEVAALQGLGVLMKDPEMALVDFPSHLEGEEVFLCWKSGEQKIQYWHRTTEGYVSRKPLTPNTLPSPPDEKKSVQ